MSSLIVKIREVSKISEHQNADRLEIAKVVGWDCIVPKGAYAVGDLVIFVPPDCLLPREFIERFDIGYLKGKNGRTGVVKLRGVHSYGIVLNNLDDLPKGMDVAAYYGIEKWEPPPPPQRGGTVRKGRKVRQRHHSFQKYTDIENIRNFPRALVPGEKVVVTEKIHGTNFRAGYVEKEVNWFHRVFGWLLPKHDFVFGSRNVEYQPGERTYFGKNVYQQIAREFNLKGKVPPGYVVYGEIFGPGIQDLTYSADRLEVVFFDVMYEGQYLDYEEAFGLLESWGLPTVPVLYRGPFSEELLDNLIGSTPRSAMDDVTMLEGIVVKPTSERRTKSGERVIFKSINPDYLTRKGGTEHK